MTVPEGAAPGANPITEEAAGGAIGAWVVGAADTIGAAGA